MIVEHGHQNIVTTDGKKEFSNIKYNEGLDYFVIADNMHRVLLTRDEIEVLYNLATAANL